MQIFHHRPSKR